MLGITLGPRLLDSHRNLHRILHVLGDRYAFPSNLLQVYYKFGYFGNQQKNKVTRIVSTCPEGTKRN